jgi:3-polyprenyl-4-hydroxybenzoate decarboxylase
MTLTGSLTPAADLIFDVSVSVPVGVDPTALATATAAFAAMVSEADFATMVASSKISF